MTENEKNARVFKAFCDPNRLKILGLLQNGEKCACKLLEELNIGQPTLSHHMKILCDADIVTGRKDGKWTYYSFNTEGIVHAKVLLDQITSAAGRENDKCVEEAGRVKEGCSVEKDRHAEEGNCVEEGRYTEEGCCTEE